MIVFFIGIGYGGGNYAIWNLFRIVLICSIAMLLYCIPAFAYDYTYYLPRKQTTYKNRTEARYTCNAKPGQTIHIDSRSSVTKPFVGSNGGLSLQETNKPQRRNWRITWDVTIPSSYRGGTIYIYSPEYDEQNNEGDRVYYGDCHLYITIPDPHTHSWSGWYTSGDNHYRKCTGCGSWLTSHNRWSSWKWVSSGSSHYRYCNNCGQTWDSADHSWDDYYGNTATCKSGGVQYRKCNTCGYVETSNTGALGHAWPTDYSQDGGYLYKNCTRCGERLETKGISYTVAYNANGGFENMENQNLTYGLSQNLKKNVFTRKDYDFLGWSTNEDDTEPMYTDEQAISNLTTLHNSTVTLYAIWKLSTTTITFHDNGGTNGPGSQTWLIGSKQHPIVPVREGYNFAGWNENEDGAGNTWPVDDIVPAGISDYYAQWIPNTYTTVYETNSLKK